LEKDGKGETSTQTTKFWGVPAVSFPGVTACQFHLQKPPEKGDVFIILQVTQWSVQSGDFLVKGERMQN